MDVCKVVPPKRFVLHSVLFCSDSDCDTGEIRAMGIQEDTKRKEDPISISIQDNTTIPITTQRDNNRLFREAAATDKKRCDYWSGTKK